jgi:RNA polymerase sigma-70 factor (sigma-E family)
LRFEDYAAGHGPALLRLAYLLTGDSHTAEDLLQAALLQVYRNWRRVERADNPDAYVRRTLVNTALSWRRRRGWWERPTLTGRLPAAAPPVTTRDVLADGVADRDRLWRMLGRLSPRARTVLVLRYYEDVDDATIAATLGVTPVTVRVTASRALAALRGEIARQTDRELR